MAEYQYSWFQFEDEDHMNKNDETLHQEKPTPSSSSSTSSSSIGEASIDSNGSSSCISSSDTTDDASSSSSSPSSSRASYDLSDIMAQLPIKRGLSKFYQGKSESFTSLSSVTSLEDLAKKTSSSYRSNLMKASRSCGNGLNNSYKHYTLPKAVISKKPTRGYSYSSFSSKRVSFVDAKPTLASPLHKDLEC